MYGEKGGLKTIIKFGVTFKKDMIQTQMKAKERIECAESGIQTETVKAKMPIFDLEAGICD